MTKLHHCFPEKKNVIFGFNLGTVLYTEVRLLLNSSAWKPGKKPMPSFYLKKRKLNVTYGEHQFWWR
jgi:hypothetical protein